MSSTIDGRMAFIASRCRRKTLVLGFVFGAATISACSTDNVLSLRPEVDVGTTTAALPGGVSNLAPPAPVGPAPILLPPVEPAPVDHPVALPAPIETAPVAPMPVEPQLVAYPRADEPPLTPPMTPAEPEAMPSDEASCRQDLKRLGVRYEELPSINDGGLCVIDHPVKVSAIGNVRIKPAATLRCEMAATIALWTQRELIPAARTRYFSGVKAIHQGSSYSCRRIRGTRTASEHSKGNALDIMRIELNNGRDIDVRKPGWFAFRQRGFLNSVRADGCDYFKTVLGPGYDYDHRNHFHFDIKERRNGYRACR